ncbi:hypothetical protein ACCT04_36405, partial [Rhizobium ruizarguesonis]
LSTVPGEFSHVMPFLKARPERGRTCPSNPSGISKMKPVGSDYRGEVKVLLANLGEEHFVISRGMRIAQMVIAPVTQARVAE